MHNASVELASFLTRGNPLVRALMCVACMRAAFPDCRLVRQFYEEYLRLEINPACKKPV